VQGEQRLAVLGELHRVGLPVAGVGAVGKLGRALGDRYSVLDVQGGAAALSAAVAALGLAPREVAAPGVVLGPGDLGVDEAVNRLVADEQLALLEGEAAGHGFGRQPELQELKNVLLKLGLSQQAAAPPAPGMCLLTGIGRLVTR